MKRFGLSIIVGVLALLVTGCFQVEQRVDLSKDGQAMFATKLLVNKTYAGSELDLFLSMLTQTIPSMVETTSFTKATESEVEQNLAAFEWVAKEPQPLDKLPFKLVKKPDGTYEFSYQIGPFDEFTGPTDGDAILLVVTVTLPRPLDFANTMDVEGNTVTWNLRKADLVKGVTLRAITK